MRGRVGTRSCVGRPALCAPTLADPGQRGVVRQHLVQAIDTLIGDITPPAELMQTQTDRKIAEEQKKTFQVQEDAQKQRQRERLQEQIGALATAFEAKHQTGKAIVWDAEAEEELHALLNYLIELLELIGLSLEHGWAYTGAGRGG